MMRQHKGREGLPDIFDWGYRKREQAWAYMFLALFSYGLNEPEKGGIHMRIRDRPGKGKQTMGTRKTIRS